LKLFEEEEEYAKCNKYEEAGRLNSTSSWVEGVLGKINIASCTNMCDYQ